MRKPKNGLYVDVKKLTWETLFWNTCSLCETQFRCEAGLRIMTSLRLSYPSDLDIKLGTNLRWYTEPRSQVICGRCGDKLFKSILTPNKLKQYTLENLAYALNSLVQQPKPDYFSDEYSKTNNHNIFKVFKTIVKES